MRSDEIDVINSETCLCIEKFPERKLVRKTFLGYVNGLRYDKILKYYIRSFVKNRCNLTLSQFCIHFQVFWFKQIKFERNKIFSRKLEIKSDIKSDFFFYIHSKFFSMIQCTDVILRLSSSARMTRMLLGYI